MQLVPVIVVLHPYIGAYHRWYVVHLYNPLRLRQPDAENPCARYDFVETVGVFRTMNDAEAAASAVAL